MARNLQEIIPAFFVGPNGQPLTPEQARARQELAESLLAKATDTSPTAGGWTSVLAKSVQGLAAGRQRHQAEEGLRLAGEKDAEIAQALLGGIGAPSIPAASSLPLGAAPVGAVASQPLDPISQRVSDAHGGNVPNVDPRIATGIVETANALGIDPVDLATTISYETGGTFDPTKSGPTTKWGQHRGLIQFGEPQAQQYGVNWQDPIGSQLGANGAVANYLRSRGVKPGMGLLDLYSTINAGSPGLYNRSDAAAGGAPGTVQDKVATQMAGHRAKAQALLTPYLSANAAPDASAGLMAYAPTGAPQAGALASAPFESAGLPQASVDPVIVATTPEEVIAAEMATGMVPNPLDLPENQMTFDYAPAQGGDYVDPLVSPQSQMGGAANPNGIVDLGPGTPGEIRTGPDGQTYQYVETNGMAGASGPMGWIRVNTGGLSGQVPANNPGIWGGGMDPNDPSTIPAMAGGTRDVLPAGSPGIFPAAPGAIAQAAAPSPSPQGGGAPVGGGLHPAIVQALSSPYASPQTRQIAGMLLQQQMQAQDPMRALQLEKAQLELEAMRNPQPQTTAEMQNLMWRAQQAGLQPGTQQYAEFMLSGGKGPLVNVDVGNGEKFDSKFAESDASALAAVSEAGLSAQRNIARIDRLGELLSSVPTGAQANFKQIAANYGLSLGDDVNNIQAAQALINALVPEQRPPGSGPMSDADLELFKQSLPRIINQPGANALIINTMRGIAEYDAQGADIVQRLRRGEINRAEAFEALKSRRNPLEGLDDIISGGASGDMPAPKSKAEMDALPSGTRFRAPDGSIRIKP